MISMNKRNRLLTENDEVIENQARMQKFSEDRAKARKQMKDFVQD